MIIYKKMSLFDAPEHSVLVHACNAQGVWGSGIAKEFKRRFPAGYTQYHNACNNMEMLANAQLVTTGDIEGKVYWMGNLFTSSGFGHTLDTENEILVNTTLALYHFCNLLELRELKTIYSNKFNSGLFKVPWEKTEAIIKVFIERYDLTWVVCDPNLD